MKRSKSHISGIRLMIQAAFFFSLMALCVKAAAQTLPSAEIVFFRSLFGLLLLLPLMSVKKVSFLGRHRKKLLTRGVVGWLALLLFFHAIARLPLGMAVLLNYMSPLFTVLLSGMVLGEKPGWRILGLIGVSFAGVYLLVDGTFATWDPAIVWGLLSAVFASTAYVTIRSIKHHESPLTIMFYFTAISTAGSGVFMIPDFRWPEPIEWVYLAGVGIGAFWAQLWMTMALRRAPASLVSPFSYLTPVLSFLYGVIFWQDPLSSRAVSGAVLIIAAGSLISHLGTLRKKV